MYKHQQQFCSKIYFCNLDEQSVTQGILMELILLKIRPKWEEGANTNPLLPQNQLCKESTKRNILIIFQG